MDKIVLTGGSKLSGKIDISGAKNAALPLMATTLLTNEKIFLENIPRLGDVGSMRELLEGVGVEIEDLTKSPASLGLKCEKITIQRRHTILFGKCAPQFWCWVL